VQLLSESSARIYLVFESECIFMSGDDSLDLVSLYVCEAFIDISFLNGFSQFCAALGERSDRPAAVPE
jgi:hypothetical protein